MKIFTVFIFLGRVISKSISPDMWKWLNGCYEFDDGMIAFETLQRGKVPASVSQNELKW